MTCSSTPSETMWKPRTDAPPSRSRSPSRSPPPGGPAASATKNGQAPKNKTPKKKLSSGTMGMRFMKRKVEAEEAAKKQAAEEEKAEAEREAMEWSAAGPATTDGGEAMSDDDDDDDAVVVPLAATAADVYGIGAAIVGRRSFGDFNKAVQETWNDAVESTARERSGARAERQQITDEELLQRYEKYVKRGDHIMANGKSPSIGNLQKKRKKKNDIGEKRKR